jgi:peptidyl-prolyl cis-trans isomerase D
MLKSLRQGGFTKGLMAAVVVLIIFAFALDYRTSGFEAGAECVVEMDGKCIKADHYQTLLRLVAPPGATNQELRQMGFIKYAVDALVERELLLREAKRLGVSVSEDDLDSALALGQVHFSWPADAPLPQALASGQPYPKTGALPTVTYLRVRNSKTDAFDYDVYRRQVQNKLRMSTKNFKDAQEDEVIAARVRQMITNSVRVSENEVYSQYEREKSNATTRLVEAKQQWFQRFATEASTADLEAFAKDKQAAVDEAWGEEQKHWAGDCPVVSELLFEYPPGADDAAKAKVQAKADLALALLKDGLDFTVVAKVYSEAANASKGGALGCLAADYGPGGADLVAAVEKLSPEQTSPVLSSPRGLHVFLSHGKLDKTAAEKLGRLATIRGLHAERVGSEQAKAYATELIARGKAGGDLAELATALNKEYFKLTLPEAVREQVLTLALESEEAPRMEVSRTFTLSGTPLFGVKGDVDVAQQVFALAKADDYLAEPVEMFTGFAVVQLKEKTQATREDFDKDKAELLRSARELRRAEVLSNYVARLREQVKKLKINPKHTGEAEEGAAPMSTSESSG